MFATTTVKPAKPGAAVLAEALLALLRADEALTAARDRYAAEDEQEHFNRAADTVYDILTTTPKKR